jgi:hypothetical protein
LRRTVGRESAWPYHDGAMRLATLLTLIALAMPGVAFAQEQEPGSPFGPLPDAPQATPGATATPEPSPSVEAQQDTDRSLLFVIAGGLLVLFVVIGRVITRDARKAVHATGHAERPKLRDQGPHKHARQAKAKARAKTRAQRRARRQNR